MGSILGPLILGNSQIDVEADITDRELVFLFGRRACSTNKRSSCIFFAQSVGKCSVPGGRAVKRNTLAGVFFGWVAAAFQRPGLRE